MLTAKPEVKTFNQESLLKFLTGNKLSQATMLMSIIRMHMKGPKPCM